MGERLEVDVAAAKIVRGCYIHGDDFTSLRKRLLERIRRVVTVDAAFIAAADPETLLFTSVWAEEPLATVGALFMGNEFGAASDVNRFASLASARYPIATLDVATGGRRKSSPRSREILAPLGLGDELRVALRAADTTWGFLCLHRTGELGFSPRDVAILKKIAPHVGEALRRIVIESLALAARPRASSETAVVLVEGDVIVGMTSGAAEWLEALNGSLVEIGERLPFSLMPVVRGVENEERALASTGPPHLTIATRAGLLLEVHAARMLRGQERSTIAITMTPAGVSARSSLVLAARGLTPAQRRVAGLVLRGLSTRDIVTELSIGEHTVQDHLKAVFDKTGVSSRRELVSLFLR